MEAKNGSYYARLHKFKAGFGTAQNDAFSYESIHTQVLIQYRIISFRQINVLQCKCFLCKSEDIKWIIKIIIFKTTSHFT